MESEGDQFQFWRGQPIEQPRTQQVCKRTRALLMMTMMRKYSYSRRIRRHIAISSKVVGPVIRDDIHVVAIRAITDLVRFAPVPAKACEKRKKLQRLHTE